MKYYTFNIYFFHFILLFFTHATYIYVFTYIHKAITHISNLYINIFTKHLVRGYSIESDLKGDLWLGTFQFGELMYFHRMLSCCVCLLYSRKD
jgi:hypothetical protein